MLHFRKILPSQGRSSAKLLFCDTRKNFGEGNVHVRRILAKMTERILMTGSEGWVKAGRNEKSSYFDSFFTNFLNFDRFPITFVFLRFQRIDLNGRTGRLFLRSGINDKNIRQ